MNFLRGFYMRTHVVSLSLLGLLFLGACAGNNGNSGNNGTANKSGSPSGNSGPDIKNSIDSYGNCTSQFVTDYRNVAYEESRLQYSSDKIAQSRVIKNACDKFFTSHRPDVNCTAQVNYKPATIS